MNTGRNYFGQLRLYSLVDLALLLAALDTGWQEWVGVLLLHVAFLAYLENRHAHPYRTKIPKSIAYILAIVGLLFYRKIEGVAYLTFSHLYTKKISTLGKLSPLFRGLQNLFLVAGIVGYHSLIPYLVGVLFIIRNLLGDVRDAGKDRESGTKTLAHSFGFKKNVPYVHLVCVIVTSIIWWANGPLSFWWLFGALIIEIGTYKLTPR